MLPLSRVVTWYSLPLRRLVTSPGLCSKLHQSKLHRVQDPQLRIFKRFLAGTSGLLAVCAFHMPYEAQAACLPVSPTSGGTVICSPNQDGNYSVSGLDTLSVNILSGAAINGTFSATDINVLDFLNSGNTNGLVTLSSQPRLPEFRYNQPRFDFFNNIDPLRTYGEFSWVVDPFHWSREPARCKVLGAVHPDPLSGRTFFASANRFESGSASVSALHPNVTPASKTEDLPWPMPNALAALLGLCCASRQNWLSRVTVSPASDEPVGHSASTLSMRLILSRFPEWPRNSFTLAKAVARCVCIFVRRAVRQFIGSLMFYRQ